MRIPVEASFDAVVKQMGGELVGSLMPKGDKPPNADYLFRSQSVIAELKCLEKETDTPEYREAMQRLADDWMKRRLILIYGTRRIDLQKLPRECQRDWFKLVESPIQKHIVADANKQIRETKKFFSLPEAKGLLLLANEGNFYFQPQDVLGMLSRMFAKKKENGQALYSHIDLVVFFSANVTVRSPTLGEDTLLWAVAPRRPMDAALADFLEQLRRSWIEHYERAIGTKVRETELSENALKEMKFVRPVEAGKFYTNSLGMKYKCIKIEDNTIQWMLLGSYQQGRTIDAEFTQLAKYSGYYSPLTDPQEIALLEQRYLLIKAGADEKD